jgi:hypothetical protein
MKLNVLERIKAIELINSNEKNNFRTFKIIKGLEEKLYINEEEAKELNFRIEENKYLWDTAKDTGVEFIFTEGEEKLIKDGLQKLDSEKALTKQYISLYAKFFPE